MPSSLPVNGIRRAIDARLFPSITTWNRLEGRPRSTSFERALRAEVRDALWMLTKQWQMGEFRGSDAGSPVAAKLRVEKTRLTKYQPGAGAAKPFEYGLPLEAKVERRPVQLRMAGRPFALDLRLAMGRQWLAMIEGFGYRKEFIDAYGIDPPKPDDVLEADRCDDPRAFAMFAAVAKRAMDGGKLYEHLVADPTAHHAYDGVNGIAGGDHEALDKAAARFLAWFERLILQPPAGSDDAWSPERLEYRFAASAPKPGGGEKVYAAEEHHGGRLDWHSLDVNAAGALDPIPDSDVTGLDGEKARTVLPVPVSFAGMPNTRWWAFEDAKTNFGDIDASTTDLAKLLFMEFALVYSNDWFVIPYTLPAGSIADVRGMAVTNTFGERFWIEAAGAGPDDDWQRWSMFTVSVDNDPKAPADTSLLLLPTVARAEQGPVGEQLDLIRDEVANMVWGVETTVPLASGESVAGTEAARMRRAFYEARYKDGPPSPEPPFAAPVRYRVMSGVPENWIPFVPAHRDDGDREIQLQRASLPRVVEGGPEPPRKVKPRTALLREGLDRSPVEGYFVNEEEVPRAGTRLTQGFERTRWSDGRVYVWLRARRQTGRGEGAGGLRFDYLEDEPPPDA
jgi:hypothetical protein